MTDSDLSPQQERNGFRCAACRAIFDAKLTVGVAVKTFVAEIMALRCPKCGSAKLLMEQGRSLPEDIVTRHLANDASIEDWLSDWRNTGEVGMSASTIADWMTGAKDAKKDTPNDISDVLRCMLLLDRIPEWKPRMREMANIGASWTSLGPRWDELEASMRAELGPDLMLRAAPKSALILPKCRALD